MAGGRPRIEEPPEVKAAITDYFNLGYSILGIVDQLAVDGFTIRKRTLQRRLHDWGLTRQHTFNHDAILQEIYTMFFELSYDDNKIAQTLLTERGLSVSARTIQRIRLKNELQRRHVTAESQAEVIEKAKNFMLEDDLYSGALRGFGAGFLNTYLRTKANIIIGRNLLYKVYRSHPEFDQYAAERSLASRVHQRNFVVPGPNFMWSLDGYEKLRKIGFSIYGCIDAYSRALIWIWVGQAGVTALSTLKQYLRAVHETGLRPYLTRSDHGTETPLWVGAQATLAGIERTTTDDLTGEGEEESIPHTQGDLIKSCHIFGPSTANQRIESWWSILMRSCTKRWIIFATYLIDTALFIPGDAADQIAVYAIYGGMIRNEVADFMRVWNGHRIRKQANRPHLRPGVPAQMLRDPTVRNYGVRLGDVAYEAMEQMMEAMEGVEVDMLLDTETNDWCEAQLEQLGFDGQLHGIDGHEYPHLDIYLALKDIIEDHMQGDRLPRLKVADPSTGGTKRFVDLLRRNGGRFSDDGSPLTGEPIPDFIVDAVNQVEERQTGLAQANAEGLLSGRGHEEI